VRNPASRIVIFNHKGGVGKTTLTDNIASAIGRLNKKVLLVDSDPQCNLTLLRLNKDFVDRLIDTSEKPEGRTIWSALKPVVDALGDVKITKPIDLEENRWLVPGDIRLVEYESELNAYWLECFARKIRGFRGTAAMSHLVNALVDKYSIDFVFYDSGPNIGPLNRIVMLDCDYFIIPAACDYFSLSAIKTLGHAVAAWIKDWSMITQLAPDGIYLLPGRPRFLGYIPQRFSIYDGAPTKAYARFFSRIEKEVQEQVVSRLSGIDRGLVPRKDVSVKLGEVRDLRAQAVRSQSTGAAIPDKSFDEIARRIVERTANWQS